MKYCKLYISLNKYVVVVVVVVFYTNFPFVRTYNELVNGGEGKSLIQSNLSTTVTSGTEESGHWGEVAVIGRQGRIITIFFGITTCLFCQPHA